MRSILVILGLGATVKIKWINISAIIFVSLFACTGTKCIYVCFISACCSAFASTLLGIPISFCCRTNLVQRYLEPRRLLKYVAEKAFLFLLVISRNRSHGYRTTLTTTLREVRLIIHFRIKINIIISIYCIIQSLRWGFWEQNTTSIPFLVAFHIWILFRELAFVTLCWPPHRRITQRTITIKITSTIIHHCWRLYVCFVCWQFKFILYVIQVLILKWVDVRAASLIENGFCTRYTSNIVQI